MEFTTGTMDIGERTSPWQETWEQVKQHLLSVCDDPSKTQVVVFVAKSKEDANRIRSSLRRAAGLDGCTLGTRLLPAQDNDWPRQLRIWMKGAKNKE